MGEDGSDPCLFVGGVSCPVAISGLDRSASPGSRRGSSLSMFVCTPEHTYIPDALHAVACFYRRPSDITAQFTQHHLPTQLLASSDPLSWRIQQSPDPSQSLLDPVRQRSRKAQTKDARPSSQSRTTVPRRPSTLPSQQQEDCTSGEVPRALLFPLRHRQKRKSRVKPALSMGLASSSHSPFHPEPRP